MALFTIDQLKTRLEREEVRNSSGKVIENLDQKSSNILSKALNEQKLYSEGGEVRKQKVWDIFLSHSSNDAKMVAGMKLELEDYGYEVYVDWIVDPQLDRSRVTKKTVATLKSRMNNCRSLFYAYTINSATSKWMPWELGYFDGKKNKAAILPITKDLTYEHNGIEFLGIYPYISEDGLKGEAGTYLWVNNTKEDYELFNKWIEKSNRSIL